MQTYRATYVSPLGSIDIASDECGRLVNVDLNSTAAATPVPEPCAEIVRQLEQYFRGERETFDIDVVPQGTPFQKQVWRELQNINYGQTISYGELARRIGKPSAVRAVGGANNRNPIPIVIPCHRVIGSDGALVGFGGGLDIKRALLAHEGALAQQLDLGL